MLEALSISEWRDVIQAEMIALEQNVIWDLVSFPPWKQAVGCRWVYKVKLNPYESLARLKVCLVAKGYSHGIDYQGTFSPMAKLTSVLSSHFSYCYLSLTIRPT